MHALNDQGLVGRLRKVAAGEAVIPLEEAARAFLEFWQRDASGHFRRKEEVFLLVLA